jgi:hypothetical protein
VREGREKREKKIFFFDRLKKKSEARAGYFSTREKVGLLRSLQVEIGCKMKQNGGNLSTIRKDVGGNELLSGQ